MGHPSAWDIHRSGSAWDTHSGSARDTHSERVGP